MRVKLKGFLRVCAISFICCITAYGANAQHIVTGRVIDNEGLPLPLAAVQVKGTILVTATDEDGYYSITITESDRNPVLVYTYAGYADYEETVGSKNVINVTLQGSVLDDVIVIGYGTVKARDVTTSISNISTKDLDQRPVVSADQALQGKAAGVQVIKPNGLPGAGMVVRVRGANSMISSNDPLYVVDGVPMTDISFLAANDIESMQVLKDASSAAIYGSRSSNGVVMITTKSGSRGNARITFNAYAGLTNLINKVESLNVAEYKDLLKDLNSNLSLADNATDLTDWYKETYKTAVTQNYQLSISDGNEKMKYYISGGYTNEDGIIKTAFFERYNFRANIESNVRSWLKIGGNFAYSDYTSNGVISGNGANRAGVVLSVINTPTYAPIWDQNNPDQYFNSFGLNITHPLENMARSESNKTKNNRLIASGNAEIKFTPYLKFKSTVSLDRTYSHAATFLDPKKTSYGRSLNGVASDDRSLGTVLVFDNILSFSKSFGKHSLDIMGGTSGTTSDWSRTFQEASNYFDGSIQSINAGNKLSQGNGTWASQWSIMSYLGRVSYNYDGKYLVTANMRADGSSKLHPDYRWGYFPSVSAAWRISSENFMEDIGWIQDLKLRVGWGQTGNQSGLGDYAYLARYSISRVNWWEEGNSNAVPIITPSNLRTRDLTWETTTQSNIGLDVSVLKGRINVTTDYYYKKTIDMLMNVNLPAGSSFATSITRNEGEMTNQGFELSISSRNFITDFQWSTDFNISFNSNKLTFLALTPAYYAARTSDFISENVVRNAPGFALGGFYGYMSDGVNPETGELMYRDMNDDEQINTSDRTYIGDPNPDFTFGLTNTFSYKGFNLNILIQGSYGNDIFNASRIETEGMYDEKNQSKRVLDRWRIPGQLTDVPKAGFDIKNSNYFVEDGSYLRVKDITLSYNIAGKLLTKWGITRLQPYVTATNLLTLTNYTGMDPEVNQWGNSGVVQGIDWGTYPQTRTFIFGINIDF